MRCSINAPKERRRKCKRGLSKGASTLDGERRKRGCEPRVMVFSSRVRTLTRADQKMTFCKGRGCRTLLAVCRECADGDTAPLRLVECRSSRARRSVNREINLQIAQRSCGHDTENVKGHQDVVPSSCGGQRKAEIVDTPPAPQAVAAVASGCYLSTLRYRATIHSACSRTCCPSHCTCARRSRI